MRFPSQGKAQGYYSHNFLNLMSDFIFTYFLCLALYVAFPPLQFWRDLSRHQTEPGTCWFSFCFLLWWSSPQLMPMCAEKWLCGPVTKCRRLCVWSKSHQEFQAVLPLPDRSVSSQQCHAAVAVKTPVTWTRFWFVNGKKRACVLGPFHRNTFLWINIYWHSHSGISNQLMTVNNGRTLAEHQGAHPALGFVYLIRWLLAQGADHENGCSLSPAAFYIDWSVFLCVAVRLLGYTPQGLWSH